MDMMSLRRRVLVNQNKLVSATGNPITFHTPLDKPLKECVVRFTPQQEGEGTPSPDNVRNISGRSSVKLWQSGKNLFDKSNVVGGFINSNGEVTGSSGSSWVHQYIYIKGINKLTISGSYSNTAARNVFFDADMNPINTGTAATTKTNRTLTVPSGAFWYGCSSFVNPNNSYRDIDTLQVEIGETATEYEPYTGNEITFSWGSDPEIGTIYGGYLDCETADLVEEWGIIASYNGETLTGAWMSDRDEYVAGTTPTIGAQVAYELETPIHYSLTPQSITTLRGDNVMWSDANGDITVRY